jgi:type VI secretion system secreted protein Hcp
MAKTNIYLRLEGVPGESIDKGHEGWIELDTFTWSVENKTSFVIGQGGQATQGQVGRITVDKLCDKASVKLFRNCTTGKHIDSGEISCLKLDGEHRIEYLHVNLKDIMVAKLDWEGRGEEAVLKEKLELEFAEFNKQYYVQKDTGSEAPEGPIEFGYNRQTSQES